MSKNAFLTNWNSIYFNETLVILHREFGNTGSIPAKRSVGVSDELQVVFLETDVKTHVNDSGKTCFL